MSTVGEAGEKDENARVQCGISFPGKGGRFSSRRSRLLRGGGDESQWSREVDGGWAYLLSHVRWTVIDLACSPRTSGGRSEGEGKSWLAPVWETGRLDEST